MTFLHPWILLLLVLPLAWTTWAWRTSLRYTAVVLKALTFAAIVVALAEPVATLPETKTAAVILVDTSASITRDDLSRAGASISQIESNKGSGWMKVVPFASQPRPLR